jgi:YihY family inner membrane protein
MKWVEKAAEAADRFQARRPWTAIPVAVWRKFQDDQASYLAALVTYFGFIAIFPLLLIFATILDMTVSSNPGLHKDLLNSALMQYPVIGQEISSNIGEVPQTGLPLAIGIGVLLFGARGVAFAIQNALCKVWDIPRDKRPILWKRWAYGLTLLLAFGIGLVVTSFLSGIAGGAGHLLSGFGAHLGAVVVSLTLNIGLFWLAFRLASMRMVRWRNLWLGAVLAAAIWQVLQVTGGYVITHQLHRSSTLYGTFGVVLGLVGWLYLQATVTVFCAEVDAVLARRQWPRSLFGGDEAHEAGGAGKAVALAAGRPAVPGQAGPREAIHPEAVRPEAVRAEAVRAEAVRAEAVRAEAVHSETMHQQTVHTETRHTETGRTEAARDNIRGDSPAA